MKKLTLIFNLSTIFAIGFLLMSINLVAQDQTPPSDLEFQGDSKSFVPFVEQSNSPLMSMKTMTTMMGLPPQSSTFSSMTRGYWFTAPSDFIITGLRVPEDASTADQNIEVIRFNSGPPPEYFSGATNDFVSLGRWVNVPGSGIIACNIPVASGDIIGILGDRGTVNSYGPLGPYTTSIAGNSVILTRMGMQYALSSTPAQNIFQEAAYYIGRVEMYYETTAPAVPLSNWAIYFGILLIAFFMVFRYRRIFA